MSTQHDLGEIDVVMPPESFQGTYRTMAEGVNKMVMGHISVKKKAMACISEFGKGNLEAELEKFPGKKAFINENIERLRATLKAFLKDMTSMADAHIAGDIDVVIPEEKFEGAYHSMAKGVNDMVMGHISVKKKAMACIKEFGDGNFEAELEKFPGKKAFINDTIEQVRKNLKALIADADLLVQAALQGKLSTRADASLHHGDFRKIVEGVNSTLDAVVGPMQDVSAVLTKLAGGDFTATVTNKYAGDYDLLTDAVNMLAKTVRSALEQIGRNVSSLASSAEELNKVSQSMGSNADETATQANVVSAAAEQVSNNVQTVATGADEMSASIKEIAKNTAEATRVASTAVRTAEATNITISKLGQSSAEIGQVIKVITSIAQQTNLLALNATIEAARAGEAGKGFAVVANEVKELAKETAKATEDISRKIEAIQGDTNGAVSAISQISQVIGQISDIQTTIASAIEEQSATTNEIGRTLAEAAKGSTDISKNIGGVAEAARATTVGATDTSKSAHSLEKMAAELQTLVSQFRY
jgi:methyl-accepting chemotaxis protein